MARQRAIKLNALHISKILDGDRRARRWKRLETVAIEQSVHTAHLILGRPDAEGGTLLTQLPPSIRWLLAGVGHSYRRAVASHQDLATAVVSAAAADPTCNNLIEQLLAYGDLSCPHARLSPENLRSAKKALSRIDFRAHPPVVYGLFSPGQSTFYIGSTVRPMFYQRFREHLLEGWRHSRGLLHGRRHEPKIKHMSAVGPHRFVMIPLVFCSTSSLRGVELALIQTLQPALNSVDDARFGTAAQRESRVSKGPLWLSRMSTRHGLGSRTHVLDLRGETGSEDPEPQLRAHTPLPPLGTVTFTSFPDMASSNSLQGIFRRGLYSEEWTTGENPADEHCLAWHTDHGVARMNLNDDHLLEIFGDSCVEVLVPRHDANPTTLRALGPFMVTQPHGVFTVRLCQAVGGLRTDRDLLIQLGSGRQAVLTDVCTDRLFGMILVVPLLERKTTRRVALRKLLDAIFQRFGAPRAPNLTLKIQFNPAICRRKVKQLVVRLVRELCLDSRLTDVITDNIKVIQTKPPTVGEFLLTHKRATAAFEGTIPPACECGVLRDLVPEGELITRDGHVATKLSALPAASFAAAQLHLKTGLHTSAAESERQIRADLDSFLPPLWQLRQPLSGDKQPYVQLDSPHEGRMARIHDGDGSHVATISKARVFKLFEDYNHFKHTHKPTFLTMRGDTFAVEILELCRRYAVGLTTATNWSVNSDFYSILFRDRPTLPNIHEGFASPLNVHDSAAVYYTLHGRDLLFCGNPDAFGVAETWRHPSTRNPPFDRRNLAQTLIWAAESAMLWPGETFHYVVVPGRGSKWASHLHLLQHPALNVLCTFPPGKFAFESPHTLSNRTVLDPAKWEVLVIMAATRETLVSHAAPLTEVFMELQAYCLATGGFFVNPNPPPRLAMGPADPTAAHHAERWPGLNPATEGFVPCHRAVAPDLRMDTVLPWDCPHRRLQLQSCLTREGVAVPEAFLARTVRSAVEPIRNLVMGPLDHNTGSASIACPVFVHDLMGSTFVGDEEHFEPVEESCREVLQRWKRTYEDARLKAYGRWNGADAQLARPYLLLKDKDPSRARPIVPYSAHPLKSLLNMASRALAFMSSNADVKTFSLDQCDSFLKLVKRVNDTLHRRPDLLVHPRSGDVKNMFSELPHDAIKEALEWVFRKYKEATGSDCVTLGPGPKGTVFPGNRKRRHYTVLTTDTIRFILHFDLDNCYYRVGEKLVRQIFGVPMGSPPSPPCADLMCSYYEDPFCRGPLRELLDDTDPESEAFLCRWADDVLGFFLTTCDTGEDADHLWQRCSTIYHECMVLETTPLHPRCFKFLSFDVHVAPNRRSITVCQHNPNALPLAAGQPLKKPRFPLRASPAALTTKTSTVKGAVLSALRAATTDDLFELSAVALVTEFVARGYSINFIRTQGRRAIRKRAQTRTRLPIFEEVTRRLTPP